MGMWEGKMMWLDGSAGGMGLEIEILKVRVY